MTLAKNLLSLALVTAAAVPAHADSWAKSQMSAASSYFPTSGTTMVVAVGNGAVPAAGALLEALQGSALELATDARALGKVDDKSDDQIVKLAFTRPIKRVAIVRVFPSGGVTKAVVTVYAAQGQVSTAFTVVPGKDLAENPNPKAASDGVARDEMESVTGARGGGSGEGGDITYQHEKIVGVTGYGVVSFDNVTFAKNGHPIVDVPALYDALDMKVEATSYRAMSEDHSKWGGRGAILTTLGTIGLVTFGTLALAAPSNDYDVNTGMSTPADNTWMWVATGISAGALVFGAYEWAAHPAPNSLTADEAITLVDKHNAKKAQTAELHFTPVASPSGGGFILGGNL